MKKRQLYTSVIFGLLILCLNERARGMEDFPGTDGSSLKRNGAPETQPQDLYALLGVSSTATSEEIRAAYSRLAIQFLPNPKDPNAKHEEFKKLTEAVSILTDPEKRSAYDAGRKRFPGS